MERVVVTGLGVVSCLGASIEDYWSGLMRAHSHPAPVADPLAKMGNRLLYAVPDEPPADQAGEAGMTFGRTSAFAVRAAKTALTDAGLAPAGDRAAVGVSIGTGVGDASLFERTLPDRAQPGGLDAFPFKVSAAIAVRLGLAGLVTSVSTACSASAYSVSLAADAIHDGEAEVVLCGGADGYTRVGIACFNRMGALDPVRCRPFDRERRGTVFGEGAALMVLESESHARRRGCFRWYATIDGAGWSCDAHHATAPEPSGVQIVRAMRDALAEAAICAEDIGCVFPHGTGTPLNDAVEERALRDVFGARLRRLPAYNLKALLGHTGGAAGAFALLTAILVLHHGVVPPNAPVCVADPEHGLNPHTGAPLTVAARHALVNAYAFGGNNISVVVGQV